MLRPSMVVILVFAKELAGVRQDLVAIPLTKTVQLPHSPFPHEYLVPVN